MDRPSGIFVGRFSDGIVIRVIGRGTINESYSVRAVADAHVDGGTIVLDATQCEYLDSTFLGCLLAIHKACEQPRNCRFLIAAPAATRIKLFMTSSLDQYFHFIEKPPDLVEQLEPLDADQLDRDTLGQHVMRCHERLAECDGREAAAFRSIASQLRKELGEAASE